VRPCSALFRELRKAKGTGKIYNSSAAFDLKFLFRTCGNRSRNFKSAALGRYDFAVRARHHSSVDAAASIASRTQRS
jgi:hypothetical protein